MVGQTMPVLSVNGPYCLVYLDVEIETGQMSDDIHCAAVVEVHNGKPLT